MFERHFPLDRNMLVEALSGMFAPNLPERCTAPADSRRMSMSEQEQAEIRLEFAKVKQEHADFDAAIVAMMAQGCDPLQIQRMKKKKLTLKDRLQQLEDKIIPDIIA